MTESEPDKAAVFLFAHQDDEMGVCHEIEATLRGGGRAVCVYLTNGAWRKVTSEVRDAETRSVLRRLGVAPEDIHFTGNETGIPSGQLSAKALAANRHVTHLLDSYSIDRLISHSWEGGHEDHDSAHWICAWQALSRGLENRTWHFNLYRSNPGFGVYYRVLAPVETGAVTSVSRICWGDRIRYLSLMLSYRSQAITIAGLLPFFALHYLRRGTQEMHAFDATRLQARPHPGKLLYELRGRESFDAAFTRLNEQLPLPSQRRSQVPHPPGC